MWENFWSTLGVKFMKRRRVLDGSEVRCYVLLQSTKIICERISEGEAKETSRPFWIIKAYPRWFTSLGFDRNKM